MTDTINNNQIPAYFDIEKDLRYLYADHRRFTRVEALRMVVVKIQVFKDLQLVKNFLKAVIRHQRERFYFVDPERPEESLYEFFADLIYEFMPVGVPSTADGFHVEWKGQMNRALIGTHNSMHNLINGFYISDGRTKADMWAGEFLNLVRKEEEPEPITEPSRPVINDKLLKITEAARILGCSRQTVYDVHLKKGLKSVKPTGEKGTQKIRYSDLIEYMENLKKS